MPKQPSSKKQSKGTQAKKSRAGAGGPKTVEGKKVARFNAVKHGLKAGQLVLILPDETEEQFEAVRAGWVAEWKPEGFVEIAMVDELIRAHWLFLRAQRRLVEAERAIAGDDNEHPVDWTEEDEHKIELLKRYKTSHERSYYRAWNAVRQLSQDRLKEYAMRTELRALQRENLDLLEKKRQLQEQGFWRESEATPEEPETASEEGADPLEPTPKTEPEDSSRTTGGYVERVFRMQGSTHLPASQKARGTISGEQPASTLLRTTRGSWLK